MKGKKEWKKKKSNKEEKVRKKERKKETKKKLNWLIYVNGMSTLLGLFNS